MRAQKAVLRLWLPISRNTFCKASQLLNSQQTPALPQHSTCDLMILLQCSHHARNGSIVHQGLLGQKEQYET